MKVMFIALVLTTLATGAFAGQVVFANFDDLADGAHVGDHYAGAHIYADVMCVPSAAHSSPRREKSAASSDGATWMLSLLRAIRCCRG